MLVLMNWPRIRKWYEANSLVYMSETALQKLDGSHVRYTIFIPNIYGLRVPQMHLGNYMDSAIRIGNPKLSAEDSHNWI